MTHRQLQRLKDKFIVNFSQFGNITTAAAHTGINRTTVYNWQEHDERFAHAFHQAEIQATETLEAEARRRAVEGVDKQRRVYDNRGNLVDEYTETAYSDTLLIFLLKARAPDKYRERVQLQHAGANGESLDLASLVKLARQEQPASA